MPFGDRTGPGGLGPMTGRGMGFCNGNDMPGAGIGGRGRGGRGLGLSRGFGYHRGFGRLGRGCIPVTGPGWWRQPDPETERQMMEHEVKTLEQELAAVRKRLTELESEE